VDKPSRPSKDFFLGVIATILMGTAICLVTYWIFFKK